MNLIFLMILGGLIGWLANQVMLSEGKNATMANVMVGALGATIGGWLMQPTTGALQMLAAALGAGLLLSTVNVVRRSGIP